MSKLKREKIVSINMYVKDHSVWKFILSNSNLAFFYGIFLFLYELRVAREYISVIHPILMIWAVIIFVYDYVVLDTWRAVPYKKTFLLFVFSALITMFITLRAGLVRNVKSFTLVILSVVTFYPVCMKKNIMQRKKVLFLSTMGAMVVLFIASLVSIALFFFNVSETITIAGKQYLFGIYMYDSNTIVVPGIYEDTNHAATFAVISALMGTALFFECRKSLFTRKILNTSGKIFGLVNLCVQMIYFPLANSRGGWLSLSVAVLIASFFAFQIRLKKKNTQYLKIKAIIASIAATCLCVLFLLGSRSLSMEAFQIMNVREKDCTENRVSYDFTKSEGIVDLSGAGRVEIWKEAIAIFSKHPIFGIGPNNGSYYAKIHLQDGFLSKGKAIHNSYIDLLVSYGIVGFTALILFFVRCMFRVLNILIKLPDKCDNCYLLVVCSVIMVACSSFFLSNIFVSCTATYYLLLVLCGYLLLPIEMKENAS